MKWSQQFYAIQCKNCGLWRSCIIEHPQKYVFKCFNCNKTKKLVKNGFPILNMKGPFIEHLECTGEVKVLNAARGGVIYDSTN